MGYDFARNAAFHDRLAVRYDEQLTRNPHDMLARQAFRELVTRLVPAGSTLLDFGCGTGLDALAYAEQGYRVLAYDNSPGMIDQLRQRCEPQIVSGEITPYSMPYPSFLDCFSGWPRPNAVLANFAALNSIPDAGSLFDAFASRLTSPGWVIASVLNPIHWTKLKTPEWWRGWMTANGPRVYKSEPYVSYLHSVASLRRAARSFQLVGRANAGSLVRYDGVAAGGESWWWETPDSTAKGLKRLLWHTPACRLLGHFVFLVWRRDR
jgi:SAM-dependent methyltransferase